MSRFLEALRSDRVLLMDGAMGTQLQRAGIREGECYELWNLTHADQVRAIHQGYAAAGADCLLTSTFRANPSALLQHGCNEQLETINQSAVVLARSAAGPDRFVLADIGPIEKGNRRNAVARMVGSFLQADALLLETASDFFDLASVMEHCRRTPAAAQLPVLFSLTFRRIPDGSLCTIHGQTPEACARTVQQFPIAALGVNCGHDIGMDETIEIIRRYRQTTALPLFARPNAGTPTRTADGWVYAATPEMMADKLPTLLEAGVRMVGGCCGTTPAHIAAFRPIIDAWNRGIRSQESGVRSQESGVRSQESGVRFPLDQSGS